MSRYFSRSLLGIHLLGVLAVAACIFLAAWQWDRAHISRSEAIPSESFTFEKLSPLRDFLPASSVGVKTTVRGTWQPDERIVMGERIADGPGMINPTPEQNVIAEFVSPIGSWVVDVLELEDGSSLGVVRGFTENPESVPLATGPAQLNGVMQPSEDAPGVHLVNQIPLLTTELITANARTIAHDGYFVSSTIESGLELVKPILDRPVDSGLNVRNVVYTFNWLIFAVIVMFMWVRIVRDHLADSAASESNAE